MRLMYLSFSDRGEALASRLGAALGGEVSRCNRPRSLAEWTKTAFDQGQGLVFVGAAGIAVRAVAPFLKSKASDPAVVAVDECGHFAVPLLSGHLGGANDLARAIGRACGAVPAVTTATDANGVFAVDEWAKRQNCRVIDPKRIKDVSAAVLAGRPVKIYSPWRIAGDRPAGIIAAEKGGAYAVRLDFQVSEGDCLRLAPRILTLGVGCRRGTPQAALEEAFAALLEQSGVFPEAVREAASIDLKREEPGLLAEARGEFTPSNFVKSVTGVDNVCERSAVLASGGALYWKKFAGNGVTMALAQAPYAPTWRWQDDGE